MGVSNRIDCAEISSARIDGPLLSVTDENMFWGMADGITGHSTHNGVAAVASSARDPASGRFLTGNSGGGRKVGSRNLLTTQFLDDLRDTWQTFGKQALERCATEEPAQFVRIVANLLPKQIEADVSLFSDVRSFAEAFDLALDTVNGNADDVLRRLRKKAPRLIESDEEI